MSTSSNFTPTLEDCIRAQVSLWFTACIKDTPALCDELDNIRRGLVENDRLKHFKLSDFASDAGLIYRDDVFPSVVLCVGSFHRTGQMEERARDWLSCKSARLTGEDPTKPSRPEVNLAIMVKLDSFSNGLSAEVEIWRHHTPSERARLPLKGIAHEDDPNGELSACLDARYDLVRIYREDDPHIPPDDQKGRTFKWECIDGTFEVRFPCFWESLRITVAQLLGRSFVPRESGTVPETVVRWPLWQLGGYIMGAFQQKHPLKYPESTEKMVLTGVIHPTTFESIWKFDSDEDSES